MKAKKSIRLCECCKRPIRDRRGNAKYCKICVKHIVKIKSLLKNRSAWQIRKLQMKVKKLESPWRNNL